MCNGKFLQIWQDLQTVKGVNVVMREDESGKLVKVGTVFNLGDLVIVENESL